MKKLSKNEIKRIISYLITGGAWFWSGYAMFAFLFSVLDWDIVPAKIVAYIFGLSVNFVLERWWVFRGKDNTKEIEKVTGRYIALSTVNLGIDTLIVWGLAQFGLTPYLGQFVSAGFFTVWNYLWYKLWVFKHGMQPSTRKTNPSLHKHRKPKK
ncbi:MAG: GtrA family protein [bacterium]|nr:GtrA family protein [bacterium]